MKKVISILAAVVINVFTVSAGSHSVGPINEIRDYTMEKIGSRNMLFGLKRVFCLI